MAVLFFVLPHSASPSTANTSTTTSSALVSSTTSTNTQNSSLPEIPTMTIPAGWKKTIDGVDPSSAQIVYESPDSHSPSFVGMIQISALPASDSDGPSAANDKSLSIAQNFSEHAVTIDGVSGTEDEFTTTINGTIHSENIYFTHNGYAYEISGRYVVGAGTQYAPLIQTALTSIQF